MIDTLVVVAYSSVIFFVTVVVYHALAGEPVQRWTLGVAFLLLFGRDVAVGINLLFHILPEKFAGDFAIFWFLETIRGETTPADAGSFAVLGLLSTPGFLLVGTSKAIVLGVNNAALSLAPYLFHVSTREVATRATARIGFWALALYPAANNFGFFGLRDPLIYLGVALLCAALLRVTLGAPGRRASLLLGVVGSVMTLWSRPELATVIVPLAVLVYIQIMRIRGLSDRRALYGRILVSFLAAPVLALALFAAFRVATADIGFAGAGVDDVVTEYGRIRYERQFEDKDLSGSASPIIEPDQYGRMSVWARVGVQTLGIVVLPFPGQIRTVEHLLAFLDSLFIMGLLFYAFRNRRTRGAGAFFWSALVAVFVMGTVVNNFGNAFRMRLILVPILAAALVEPRLRAFPAPEEGGAEGRGELVAGGVR